MNSLQQRLTAVMIGVFLAAVPAMAAEQLTPGSQVYGSIDRQLNSKTAQVGDTFKLVDVYAPSANLQHATIYGHVAEVQSGGAGRKAQIRLAVDKIQTSSGTYAVVGHVTNVKANTKSNAGREAGSSAAGALIGGLIGGWTGAVIGGGTGFLVSKNVHENVTIPQGAVVTVQLDSVRRQS